MGRPDRTTSGMALLWLGLVSARCLKDAADDARPMISPAERLMLLDAAMRSHGAQGYLASVQRSFDDAGHDSDVRIAGVPRALLWLGEIEIVMHMRVEWLGRLPAPSFASHGPGD